MTGVNRHGHEVTSLRWFTLSAGGVIGIVLLVDRTVPKPYFKVYIGHLSGSREGRTDSDDALAIAARGVPIGDEQLARLLAGPRVTTEEYWC